MVILMRKVLVAVVAALCLTGGDVRARRSCVPAAQCCRICDNGKACGNSCIHAAFSCHKEHGCACNRSEVCEQLKRDLVARTDGSRRI